MITLWCLFAAAVFVASTIVHVSTFFGIDFQDVIPQFMFLHLLLFPPFIAAPYYLNRVTPNRKDFDQWLQRNAPRTRTAMMVLGLYAGVGFVLFGVFGRGGGPARQDGKFVITSHGRVLREVTEAEYRRLRGFEIRFMSGFWMAFSGIPTLLLVAARQAPRIGDNSAGSNVPTDRPFKVVRRGEPGEDPILIFTPDELPKEVPSEAGAGPGSASDIVLFTFEGPDGREFQFRSLAEMPPDIRAQFERMMGSDDETPLQ